MSDENKPVKKPTTGIPNTTPGFNQMMVQARSYQGPFPEPNMLAQYEKILPGAAERLLTYTEANQKHRHELEKEGMRREYAQYRLGQIFGLIIILAMLIIGSFLIYNNKSLEGLSLILIQGSAMVGIYVYSFKKSETK